MDPIKGLPPFREQFPQLFSICTAPECTVSRVRLVDTNTFFRRGLSAELSEQWKMIRATVGGLTLTSDSDWVSWGLNQNGKFSTKSVYKWLERSISGCHYRWIWRAKLPLKIKIFLWLLHLDSLWCNDQLQRRGWENGYFCPMPSARVLSSPIRIVLLQGKYGERSLDVWAATPSTLLIGERPTALPTKLAW